MLINRFTVICLTLWLLAVLLFLSPFGNAFASTPDNSQAWSQRFDGEVRFYQTTELGVLVVGTNKSLYVVDCETGDILWRKKNIKLDEIDVVAVPGTDIVLLSFEKDKKTRVEAADIFTGDTLWQSDKVKGSVMQMVVDVDANLLATVFVKNAKGKVRDNFKRKPTLYAFDLATGNERWHYEMESEVEMMPLRWSEDKDKDTEYTLDNYRPPAFLNGNIYLFYEGVTTVDARTGKKLEREKFRVNEEGLALTEADPVFDEKFIYVSGRGKVRAISRLSSEIGWEAKDVGVTPEMLLSGGILYVRTGGQFTRLEDGEVKERGDFGVSAIDTQNGKVIWRYKGADKGITNLVMPDSQTILLADRDDLISLDRFSGKRRFKVSHKIKKSAFVLINDRGEVVVGGQEEIAGFDPKNGREKWHAEYNPPGRGVLRTVAAVAARAASLYFRYGGFVSTAFRGAQLARTVNAFRWSGLTVRGSFRNLTSLAVGTGRGNISTQFAPFGVATRLRRTTLAGRPRLTRFTAQDVEERLMDKLDPSTQLERLSRFLWSRERLAVLQGRWMYFYTDLKRKDGRGLVGVNTDTGRAEREIRLNEADDRIISDELIGLLYVSQDNCLYAFKLDN